MGWYSGPCGWLGRSGGGEAGCGAAYRQRAQRSAAQGGSARQLARLPLGGVSLHSQPRLHQFVGHKGDGHPRQYFIVLWQDTGVEAAEAFALQAGGRRGGRGKTVGASRATDCRRASTLAASPSAAQRRVAGRPVGRSGDPAAAGQSEVSGSEPGP